MLQGVPVEAGYKVAAISNT